MPTNEMSYKTGNGRYQKMEAASVAALENRSQALL